MSEYAMIDLDGTYWLNLKKRGWVKLETLLDEADRDRRRWNWVLGISLTAALWSILCAVLIGVMLT